MREIVMARHVLLEFNGRDVLNISELSVAENERIGLIGANGSGKTSLLRILSGNLETAACRIVRYGNVLFVPQVSVIRYNKLRKFRNRRIENSPQKQGTRSASSGRMKLRDKHSKGDRDHVREDCNTE